MPSKSELKSRAEVFNSKLWTFYVIKNMKFSYAQNHKRLTEYQKTLNFCPKKPKIQVLQITAKVVLGRLVKIYERRHKFEI